MSRESCKLVIESVREDGDNFRPSDWIERISSALGSFGRDHRLHYRDAVKPGIINGEKCLIVDQNLEVQDPAAWGFVIDFARTNRLKLHTECGVATN